MATFEQVMTALRNADAAGDKDAATRLAQIAQSMRAKPVVDPLAIGPMDPPPVELQGQPKPMENKFGDVTLDVMRPAAQATKAFAQGVFDQSQSPTMRAMPEDWSPALKSIYARVGDAAMTGISALGTAYAGAAGLAGEVIAGSPTQERKLANDLMMMGEVAVPELAGVSSTNIMAGKAAAAASKAKAPTQKQLAARAAGDLGVTPSLGMTGKPGAMTAAALEKVPGSASVIAKDAARAVSEVEGAFNKIKPMIGNPLSPVEAGAALQGGLRKFVEGFKGKAGQLFDAIPMNAGDKVKAQNTLSAISDAKAAFAENPELAKRLGLTNWDAVASEIANNNISWGALKQFRTEVGQALGSPTGSLTDTTSGRLKSLYGALTADMEAATKASSPQAFSAWQRANQFYKSGAQRIERSLDGTITAKSPERAFEAFAALTKADRSTADITRMRQIKASLARDDWNDVASSIVNRLGSAAPGTQNAEGTAFSPSRFLSEWNRMSPEARKILLPEDARVELEKLARISERVKAANLERNTSNTGTVVVAAGAGGALMQAPISTISALAGANIGARAMTSPVFLRALNRAAMGDTKQISAMATGSGAFAQDAKTILRMMAAETALGGAANSDSAPLSAVSR